MKFHSARQHLGGPKRAFTIIEVMISLAMLAIIISAIFSQMFTLSQVADLNGQQAALRSLNLGISNAFAAAPFEKLRSSQLRWSLGRYCPTATPTSVPNSADIVFSGGDDNQPMTDDPLAPANRCLLRYTASGAQGLGLIDNPTGLKDVRVWVEYYRGNDFDVNADGVISPATDEVGLIDSPPAGLPPLMVPPIVYANHLTTFSNTALSGYRLSGPPKDQADPEGTVAIRVVITYRVLSTSADPRGTDMMTSIFLSRRR